MSLIDVSDLTLDVDIAGQQFTVIRRSELVDNSGDGNLMPTTYGPLYGAIYPTGDNALARTEEFSTQEKTITVLTKFRLTGPQIDSGGATYNSDIIVWKGNNYEVIRINDYGSFGQGFIEAECQAVDYLVQLPQILMPWNSR